MRYLTFPLFLALSFLVVFAGVAHAATQTMDYEVYAGGANMVTATLNLDSAAVNGPYHIRLATQTKGLLGRLASWHGAFSADGMVNKEQLQPFLFQSSAVWHQKTQSKQFHYNPDGSFAGFQESDTDKNGRARDATPKDFDPKLAAGTTDSLSATLAVLRHVAGGGACEGGADVFDGLRRFKLIYHPEGVDSIAPSGLNVYSGPAQRCTVEVVPVAGKWHEKPRGWLSIQEQGRQKGNLPTLWMAKLADGTAAIPVRVQVTTNYGVLFLQLARYDSGTRHLTAANAPR